MGNSVLRRFKRLFGDLKLNRKIQISFMLLIIPLFIIFMLLFINIYKTNSQYNQTIANSSKAGRFSIKFKEEFDYKIYLLIAGHSSFSQENPYSNIVEARNIAYDLIKNTNYEDNKHRARIILKLLDNLEKYVKRIEENKKKGGYYDQNITIWEKDVQIVTDLIQSTILEYNYYETKAMEQIRLEMLGSLREITMFSIVIFAILIVLELGLSFIIPNSIVKPINHLNEVTKRVAKGDLSVRAKVPHGAEMKNLADSLNSMIVKIEYLLNAVKAEEENLRMAELELLQGQINPHFLYNTLDTIMWLAESGKQGKIVAMITSLSDFFRSSLNHGDGMFTLKEEEKHIRSYLEIQQVRYQDILDYEINLPDNLKSVIIPKISLQPIVENALYHGIKNRRRKGKIKITATRYNDDIVILVTDNGIGICYEQLEKINNFLQESSKKECLRHQRKESYGLYNVNKRIKLKFGDSYGVFIQSTYGEGTEVQVRIPF